MSGGKDLAKASFLVLTIPCTSNGDCILEHFLTAELWGEIDILASWSPVCSLVASKPDLMKAKPVQVFLILVAQDEHTLLDSRSVSLLTVNPRSHKTSANFRLLTPSRLLSTNKFCVEMYDTFPEGHEPTENERLHSLQKSDGPGCFDFRPLFDVVFGDEVFWDDILWIQHARDTVCILILC